MGDEWNTQLLVILSARFDDQPALLAQLALHLPGWCSTFAANVPGGHVDAGAFAEALTRVLGSASEPDERRALLETLRGDELLLACAALHDEPSRVALSAMFEQELDKVMRKFSVDADGRDELRQVAREHVLVGKSGRPGALAEYSGRGSLRGFLRVSISRTCLNWLNSEQRSQRRRASDDDLLGALPSPAIDPEIAHLRSLYHAEFMGALREAFGALSPRHRTLLRQHHLDGLLPGELGPLYGVHRTTVLRWLGEAHRELADATRSALARSLGASPAEVESLIRVLGSQLHMSLERHLAGA